MSGPRLGIGTRRSGRTTFPHQVRLGSVAAGVPRQCVPSLSFEDERLAGMTAEHLGPILEEYCRRHPAHRGRLTVTWCLDEVRLLAGWERFVRRLRGGGTELIQVSADASGPETAAREVRGPVGE